VLIDLPASYGNSGAIRDNPLFAINSGSVQALLVTFRPNRLENFAELLKFFHTQTFSIQAIDFRSNSVLFHATQAKRSMTPYFCTAKFIVR